METLPWNASRPDLRRPTVPEAALWSVVALLALVVAVVAALVAVGVLIEPQSTTVDPTGLPAGTQVGTIER